MKNIIIRLFSFIMFFISMFIMTIPFILLTIFMGIERASLVMDKCVGIWLDKL